MDVAGQFKQMEDKILPEILSVLRSGRYILGPKLASFEKEFAAYCGAQYSIGTNSGTHSILYSLLALGVGSGDEVITVPNTFTATAEAIYHTGAKIVFCDVDEKTFNMDPVSFKAKITSRTKAVIPVHLHGNPAQMDEITKIAKKRNIHVVEDAAQAHGASFKGKKIGSLKSDLTCFSFHPVKNLGAAGDGGAICTNSASLAKKIRLFINHGRTNHYHHLRIGTTGRLDEIQAAILSVKLKYLDRNVQSKKRLVEIYEENLPKQITPIKHTENSQSAHHVFAVLSKHRDELAKHLTKNNIEVGLHYPIPLHLQPAYKFLGYRIGDFPVAEKYARQTISLPLYPHMTPKEQGLVIGKIKEFFDLKKNS